MDTCRCGPVCLYFEAISQNGVSKEVDSDRNILINLRYDLCSIVRSYLLRHNALVAHDGKFGGTETHIGVRRAVVENSSTSVS